MNYRIHGANHETGHELSTTIESPNREVAIEIAASRGILVSEIEPQDDGTLPLRPDVHSRKSMPAEPKLRFLRREAFAFGFYAGLGLLLVYVSIRILEAVLQTILAAVDQANR